MIITITNKGGTKIARTYYEIVLYSLMFVIFRRTNIADNIKALQ